MFIERPSGLDVSGERVELTIRDENGLRVASVSVVIGLLDVLGSDIIRINIGTVPGDNHVVVETRQRATI
jgi:hypothetical protein